MMVVIKHYPNSIARLSFPPLDSRSSLYVFTFPLPIPSPLILLSELNLLNSLTPHRSHWSLNLNPSFNLYLLSLHSKLNIVLLYSKPTFLVYLPFTSCHLSHYLFPYFMPFAFSLTFSPSIISSPPLTSTRLKMKSWLNTGS